MVLSLFSLFLSSRCCFVQRRTPLRHLNIGQLVQEHECHDGKDEEFDSYLLNEDKLLDVLEPLLEEGGLLIEFHSPEVIPPEYLDLVLVLRTDNTRLYDRLEDRGYRQNKVQENVECEIMQVVLEEAREAFPEEIVSEVRSDTVEEMEQNVDRLVAWYEQWIES